MPRDEYIIDDSGELLRMARRYLEQWTVVPPPSARVAGGSSPQLVYLLAKQVERLQEKVDKLEYNRR